MSFSSNVKQELCRQPLTKRSAAVAEAYGVLLYCNTFTPSAIRIVTESADFAARLPRLFKKAFGFAFDSEPAEQGGGKLVFEITDAAKIGKIFAAFGDHPQTSVTLHVNFGILEEDADRLAGNFLTVGPRRIIGVAGQSEALRTELKHRGGKVTWVGLDNLCKGYGAAHCMTQVLRRR